MNNFKHKLFHYEETPPKDVWENVSSRLNEYKVIKMQGLRGRSRFSFYAATAAAALVIIFAGSVFFSKKTKQKNLAQNSYIQAGAPADSTNNHHVLERIIQSAQHNKPLASLNKESISKKYITIAGPDGQPVKISAKVATLILWADNEYPPRPVWNNKIDKWQQIMLSSTASPTSAGLLEVIQSSSKLE